MLDFTCTVIIENTNLTFHDLLFITKILFRGGEHIEMKILFDKAIFLSSVDVYLPQELYLFLTDDYYFSNKAILNQYYENHIPSLLYYGKVIL